MKKRELVKLLQGSGVPDDADVLVYAANNYSDEPVPLDKDLTIFDVVFESEKKIRLMV